MKEPINIKARPVETAPAALNLGDLYYICFRHKWKIVIVFIAGLVGAAGFYFTHPPVFESEAKILIHYVVERSPRSGAAATGEQIINPDAGGEGVLNSEVEILTSFDLAGQVADAVKPEKILARLGGGNSRTLAASMIRRGLEVETPRRGSIIRIVFRHPDAILVQEVLSQLVDTYLKRHGEIHNGVGIRDTFFVQQADLLKNRIAQTEVDLKKLKADAQVISLDGSKQAYTEEITKINGQLREAAAELAERRASLNELNKTIPSRVGETNTNVLSLVPAGNSEHYRRVVSDLADRQRQLSAERARYTDQHFSVRNLTRLVADLEGQKLALEQAHPGLTRLSPVASPADNSSAGLAEETRRVSALEARISVLKEQIQQVWADANRVLDAEPAISELTRKKSVDEASLFSYLQSSAKVKIEESLDAGKITNISVIQSPTPPAPYSKGAKKPLMMILAFGCLGGLAWAFALEKFLNQTVKRGVDLERQLHVPLFLSVPDMGWNRGLRLPSLGRHRNGHHPPALPNGSTDAVGKGIAPWEPEHKLRPYYEGLRDRLITYFEVRNMNHKPKLIAVTSCTIGAGVTTMAAGLAASLSETGDGNVLLVDMNVEQGAAHPFYQGKPCALSEAFEPATRNEAFVQENLYLVSACETNNEKLPRVLPRRFASLVPKMKASDYDYIIFDMPPITQTSVTARLSGFMDMVLMVVESEKTDQEILKRSHGLLQESNATVAAILNKHRRYVPEKLSPELS